MTKVQRGNRPCPVSRGNRDSLMDNINDIFRRLQMIWHTLSNNTTFSCVLREKNFSQERRILKKLSEINSSLPKIKECPLDEAHEVWQYSSFFLFEVRKRTLYFPNQYLYWLLGVLVEYCFGDVGGRCRSTRWFPPKLPRPGPSHNTLRPKKKRKFC